MPIQQTKIMAIASGGGHWHQLMRLRPALDAQQIVFVTTNAAYISDIPEQKLVVVTDANRRQPLRLMLLAFQLCVELTKQRPDVVISTGAAPGLLGIALAHLLGARTLWIDSIANAEKVSLSGRLAKRIATHSLTQWVHLAHPDGPDYRGNVL